MGCRQVLWGLHQKPWSVPNYYGISVALLHPGFVRTDMTGHRGLLDADESVRGLLARMDELTPENSGSFRHQNGETLPW